jgi:antitoxin VapB
MEAPVALNIKDAQTERLAAELAAMTGESKTRTIRRALEERRERLALQVVRRKRDEAILQFLEQEVWPTVARSTRGRRLTRRQEERILGYGRDGV